MLTVLIAILAFLVAMVPLVAVHEWGHFWVARRLGVKIIRFSIGFNFSFGVVAPEGTPAPRNLLERLARLRYLAPVPARPLWSRRFGADQTELTIGMVPLGGYVKMVDENEGQVAPEDLPRAFNRQPVWKRALIVLGGPMANLLFAFVLFAGMQMYGTTQLRPEIMGVRAGSLAEQAGFRTGDQVVAVNDDRVVSWGDVDMQLLLAALQNGQAQLEVSRADGSRHQLQLDFSGYDRKHLDPRLAGELGLLQRPQSSEARIGGLAPKGPAAAAGLREQDRILAIDGKPVTDWDAMAAIISASPERPLRLDIQRGTQRLQLTVTPARVLDGAREVGRIGVAPVIDWPRYEAMIYELQMGPLAAASYAWDKGASMTRLTLEMLGRMLIGQVSLKNVSGPIGIADMAGQTLQAGAPVFLGFLVIMSLSLGIMNLLPVPVLDGGHLMYYLAEAIRGRPLSARTLELGQRLGLMFLLLLTLLAVYNDVLRLILSY